MPAAADAADPDHVGAYRQSGDLIGIIGRRSRPTPVLVIGGANYGHRKPIDADTGTGGDGATN